MTWRVAEALLQLRSQVNAMWPDRSKDSDGTIGDESHASRSSDHNPWFKENGIGIVTGMDITHDPAHGFDSYAFADMLLKKRDPRIKYVISNRRIGAGNEGPSAWTWRHYSGANAHDHHVHISVLSDKAHYDLRSAWSIDAAIVTNGTIAGNYVAPPSTLKLGANGDDVTRMQTMLKAKGGDVVVDGVFGPHTKLALQTFQAEKKLVADGICGPATWAALA